MNSGLKVVLGFLLMIALLYGDFAPLKECASNRGRIRVTPLPSAINQKFAIVSGASPILD